MTGWFLAPIAMVAVIVVGVGAYCLGLHDGRAAR